MVYAHCTCHVHVLLFYFNTAYNIIDCLNNDKNQVFVKYLSFFETVEFKHFAYKTKNNLVFCLILETVQDGLRRI